MTVARDTAADPAERITAHVFERVFGAPPAAVAHIPGELRLLPGLTAHIPWGATVARGPGPLDVYSMNHHTERHTSWTGAPAWAVPALAALRGDGAAGARLVVNRELPDATGLLDGSETYRAVTATGEGRTPAHQGERVACDLEAAGLRLLIMEVAAAATAPAAAPDAGERAVQALRSGDLRAFGAALSHGHVRGAAALDRAADAAREAGAWGAVPVGRCAVALAHLEDIPRIRQHVTERVAEGQATGEEPEQAPGGAAERASGGAVQRGAERVGLRGGSGRAPRFLTAVPGGHSLGVNGRR